jgi:opacity protein-like surface antigen
VSFRVTTSYRYQKRDNVAGQQSEFNTGTMEVRYAPVSKGIYSARFSIIDISYNAPENTSIAYEMLEGLRPGTNFTWGIGLQRTLSKSIQISVNYEGRKPDGVKTIHTGTMQARAFF